MPLPLLLMPLDVEVGPEEVEVGELPDADELEAEEPPMLPEEAAPPWPLDPLPAALPPAPPAPLLDEDGLASWPQPADKAPRTSAPTMEARAEVWATVTLLGEGSGRRKEPPVCHGERAVVTPRGASAAPRSRCSRASRPSPRTGRAPAWPRPPRRPRARAPRPSPSRASRCPRG